MTCFLHMVTLIHHIFFVWSWITSIWNIRFMTSGVSKSSVIWREKLIGFRVGHLDPKFQYWSLIGYFACNFFLFKNDTKKNCKWERRESHKHRIRLSHLLQHISHTYTRIRVLGNHVSPNQRLWGHYLLRHPRKQKK